MDHTFLYLFLYLLLNLSEAGRAPMDAPNDLPEGVRALLVLAWPYSHYVALVLFLFRPSCSSSMEWTRQATSFFFRILSRLLMPGL